MLITSGIYCKCYYKCYLNSYNYVLINKLYLNTLSDKISSDKIFDGQNISSDKISTPSRNFDSFVRFLPDFGIEILDKIFDGQNFRH